MQILQVIENSIYGNYSCQHCKRKVKAQQWILHLQLMDVDTLRRTVIHVKCLRAMIADVPDEDEDAFESLRAQILATGQVFPT
jgi:hypothetical protein